METYASSGTIKWTGYPTSENSVRLSYPYTIKSLQAGALINGSMAPLDEGRILVKPLNYKLKSGEQIVTQKFGPSIFSTTIPINITPASSYENTTIEILISFSEIPASAVLTGRVWIG